MERVLQHTKLPLLVVPAVTQQKHAEENKEEAVEIEIMESAMHR